MAKFTCNFISYTLKRTVDITVVVPSPTIPESMGMGGGTCSHTPKDKYPVLYLLHGMGNNHATWTGYTNVELFAEERQIAIVNLSAENKSYVKLGGDDFFTFVSEEVPDFVCGMFPVSREPEHTYIAGLSMGGYGTLVHALNRPERFRRHWSPAGPTPPPRSPPIPAWTLSHWRRSWLKRARLSPRHTSPAAPRTSSTRLTWLSGTSSWTWA